MNKLYGVTHDINGAAIVRLPRVTKVSIGLPKGKDVHVWIDANGKWAVQAAQNVVRLETRDQAIAAYREAKPRAPERAYPRKLAYFTFVRIGGDGNYDPDFDTIEAHGPLPTEIDIIFTDDEPFSSAYQMWGATELKCSGNGLCAERIVAMGDGKYRAAAEAARKAGSRHFVLEECAMRGCSFVRGDKPACKPHGRLRFQLIASPRLGGEFHYDTTSYRSVSNLFSCLHLFKSFTGGGDPERGFIAGVPLKLVVRPFRVRPSDRVGTAYAVSLEFRAETAAKLRQRLIETALEYRALIAPMPTAPVVALPQLITARPDQTFDDEATEAAAMTAEFAGTPETPGASDTSNQMMLGEVEALRERMQAALAVETARAEAGTERASVAATEEIAPENSVAITPEDAAAWADIDPSPDAEEIPDDDHGLFSTMPDYLPEPTGPRRRGRPRKYR